MSETLRLKEEEVETLHSKVKGLQSTVKGADGRIALLQFQLQRTKNVLQEKESYLERYDILYLLFLLFYFFVFI